MDVVRQLENEDETAPCPAEVSSAPLIPLQNGRVRMRVGFKQLLLPTRAAELEQKTSSALITPVSWPEQQSSSSSVQSKELLSASSSASSSSHLSCGQQVHALELQQLLRALALLLIPHQCRLLCSELSALLAMPTRLICD
eukprot:scaffold25538_cov22-Tisochrysis_lutea.AAC.1